MLVEQQTAKKSKKGKKGKKKEKADGLVGGRSHGGSVLARDVSTYHGN